MAIQYAKAEKELAGWEDAMANFKRFRNCPNDFFKTEDQCFDFYINKVFPFGLEASEETLNKLRKAMAKEGVDKHTTQQWAELVNLEARQNVNRRMLEILKECQSLIVKERETGR